MRYLLVLPLTSVAAALACAFHLTASESAAISVCDMRGPPQTNCVACRDGDAAACMRLAADFAYGATPRLVTGGALLAEARACELGAPLGCLRAHARSGDRVSGLLAQRAREVCRDAACDGSPDACLVRQTCDCEKDECLTDAMKAAVERQCHAGHIESCRWIARRLPSTRAVTAMRVGCAAGDPPSCLELAAARMMGFGQTADIVEASATFARMCDETGSVNACRAVDGYLSSAWMQEHRRKERGAAKPIRREPPRAALAELGLRGRSTGIVGFCLGADGRVRTSRTLQSWGDARVDAILAQTVMAWEYPGHTEADFPCWIAEFNMTFI